MLPLAQRYAIAFLNVFGDRLTLEILHDAQDLCNFLRSNHRVTFFLKLSILDTQTKQQGLYELCDRFALGEPFKKLIDLLSTHNRLPLLEAVICHLQEEYLTRNNIHPFMVKSSRELEPAEQEPIEQFLARQVTGTILCTYVVDKRLIAGIALQSPNYFWQQSIAGQLRAMHIALSR